MTGREGEKEEREGARKVISGKSLVLNGGMRDVIHCVTLHNSAK